MSLIASFFLAYSITSATVCLFVKAVPLMVPWRLSQEVSTFSIVIVLPTNLVQSLVPLDRPSKFTRATGRVSWFLDDKVKTVSMTYFILFSLLFVKWLTFCQLDLTRHVTPLPEKLFLVLSWFLIGRARPHDWPPPWFYQEAYLATGVRSADLWVSSLGSWLWLHLWVQNTSRDLVCSRTQTPHFHF